MNPASPDYSDVEPIESISCVSCHDPHSDANPFQLRIVKRDKLANGYVVPDRLGGNGQLCMNCHRARENTKDRVTAQLNVFRDRFYPHYSPQADMYLGANGYEYDLPITGLGSHHGLDDGCVTCHMYERIDGTSKHSNHQMNLIDEQGNDIVTPCRSCHGSQLTKFDDIKAAADFDGNGTVEGVQTEIKGMLNTLKALLPKNTQGEPVNMAAEFRLDSMAVKANPEFYPAIMNYYFVKYDHSYGIHNTKYAVALLQASLARLITGVDLEDQRIPNTFSLGQNYPNPFNPSTKISFSVARTSSVFIGVYNSTGELVATLSDGTLTPGKYTTSWNGAGLPSGTYFCRMTAVSNGSQAFSTTKKMMLVK
jgi:predicted CXXCH cytochrome family protein